MIDPSELTDAELRGVFADAAIDLHFALRGVGHLWGWDRWVRDLAGLAVDLSDTDETILAGYLFLVDETIRDVDRIRADARWN